MGEFPGVGLGEFLGRLQQLQRHFGVSYQAVLPRALTDLGLAEQADLGVQAQLGIGDAAEAERDAENLRV